LNMAFVLTSFWRTRRTRRRPPRHRCACTRPGRRRRGPRCHCT
jgi:hypothetical protein